MSDNANQGPTGSGQPRAPDDLLLSEAAVITTYAKRKQAVTQTVISDVTISPSSSPVSALTPPPRGPDTPTSESSLEERVKMQKQTARSGSPHNRTRQLKAFSPKTPSRLREVAVYEDAAVEDDVFKPFPAGSFEMPLSKDPGFPTPAHLVVQSTPSIIRKGTSSLRLLSQGLPLANQVKKLEPPRSIVPRPALKDIGNVQKNRALAPEAVLLKKLPRKQLRIIKTTVNAPDKENTLPPELDHLPVGKIPTATAKPFTISPIVPRAPKNKVVSQGGAVPKESLYNVNLCREAPPVTPTWEENEGDSETSVLEEDSTVDEAGEIGPNKPPMLWVRYETEALDGESDESLFS